MQDTGSILTGLDNRYTSSAELRELMIQAKIGNQSYSQYYLDIKGKAELMQTGYAPQFQDPGAGGNQAHHFWFYVQVGYESGLPDAIAGSALHETLLAKDAAGKSYQDYALGVEGGLLGQALMIGAVKPSEVGDYIRQTLSPGSLSAYNWSHPFGH
jgi:hypothetical protein